jgi:glutaredoxin
MKRRAFLGYCGGALASALLACKTRAVATADDAGALAGGPPFVVRPDTTGMIFTWIDERGEFQTVMSVKEVPLVGQDTVKVIDPDHDEGTHEDKVFVADLRSKLPDGTYAVHTMSRADFDQIAIARRKARGPTLADAPDARAPSAGGGDGLAGAQTGQGSAAGAAPGGARPLVIIYGASWCSACHEAAAYLKRKGVPFVEKDVEEDPSAQREMQQKLQRAGLRGGSIPVIDVRGRVMVGFNPRTMDEALGRAL